MHVDTNALRSAASTLVTAREDIAHARTSADSADDPDLGDLSATMQAASKHVVGVLDTVLAVQDEFATNLNACADKYVRTDHKTAGTFHELY